eukprot:sb/3468939/
MTKNDWPNIRYNMPLDIKLFTIPRFKPTLAPQRNFAIDCLLIARFIFRAKVSLGGREAVLWTHSGHIAKHRVDTVMYLGKWIDHCAGKRKGEEPGGGSIFILHNYPHDFTSHNSQQTYPHSRCKPTLAPQRNFAIDCLLIARFIFRAKVSLGGREAVLWTHSGHMAKHRVVNAELESGKRVGTEKATLPSSAKEGDSSFKMIFLPRGAAFESLYNIYLDQNAEFLRQPTRKRIKFGHPLVSGP